MKFARLGILIGSVLNCSRSAPQKSKNTEPTSEAQNRSKSLDDRCTEDEEWDQKSMKELLQLAKTSKVVMFGIDHGEDVGDRRDGEFVASLLPQFHAQGFRYFAVECPSSLNSYTQHFEEEAKKVFAAHWTEFGPPITRARELGMRLICYDVEKNWVGTYGEREIVAWDNLQKNIFASEPDAKVVIYAGAKHLHKTPVEVSFLEPEEVKTIGYYLEQQFPGLVTTVYLQPEKSRVSFFYDLSFYLSKHCRPI